jgi:uncharacterized protein (DUF433 family)
MSERPKPRGWYLAHGAGLLAGVSGETIGSWARYGYIRSSWSPNIPRVYSFQDVAEAIVVHELLDRGVPHSEIRTGVETLRADYGDWPLQWAPIATTARKVVGAHIVRKQGDQAWELGRKPGQGVLSFVDLEGINELLRRGGWALKELPDVTHIEVDPDRLSGRPTIRSRRVPADKVAQLAALESGHRILATEYDITRREADDAVQWYERAIQLQRAA